MAQTRFKSKIDVNSLVVNSSITLAGSQVTTAAIQNSAVTNSKLAGGAVGMGSGTHGVVTGKLDAIMASVTTATLNITTIVTHGLGRTPIGFLAVAQDKAANFYKSRATMATSTHLWVDCDTTTVVAKLLIF